MRLYRHYKNKPYKYLGVAKHSETLDEVVLYETLYQNDLGKLWVRPRKMFDEDIQLDGKSQARFAKVPLEIKTLEKIASEDLFELKPLFESVFNDWDQIRFAVDLKERGSTQLLKAYIDGKLVGFQIGYEQSLEVFYSWLGAVKPEFRNLGIATDLMRVQHEWCLARGYKKVQTELPNYRKEMLILKLKNGFEITGVKSDIREGLNLIMEKQLR